MLRLSLVFVLLLTPLFCQSDWQKIEAKGRNRTVRFHAWAGSNEINRYLKWCQEQLKLHYGIDLVHVPVRGPEESVRLLESEARLGKVRSGDADLIWINGENFRVLRTQDLLYGPFTKLLPNMEYVDYTLPVDQDFTLSTDGFEAPWGLGQLNFLYDADRTELPPSSAQGFLKYAKQFPQRLTYPYPDNFHGYSFLKQLLLDIFDEQPEFYRPVEEAVFEPYAQILFAYLDQLHPYLYSKGQVFSSGSTHERQLLAEGKIDLAIQFNPFSAKGIMLQGQMLKTLRNVAFERGSLTNCHFLAIPKNSDNKSASLVVTNFLLSPVAQGKKAKPEVWGDPSVLDRDKLPRTYRHLLPVQNLFFPLSEPHPSWQTALKTAWFTRYGPRR